MQAIKQQAHITLIIITDDEAPGPDWLKIQLEKIPGVAISRVDAFANQDILSVSLGPQKPKEGG